MDRTRARHIGKWAGICLVALLALGAVIGLADSHAADQLATVGGSIGDAPGVAVDRGSASPATNPSALDHESAAGPIEEADNGQAAAVGSGTFNVPMIRTGSIDVEIKDAKDLAKAVDQVLAIVPDGGYVERSSSDVDRASLTLRIPAASYDTTIAAVRGLGRVTASTTDAEDVSGEVVDLNARLTILEAQRASLEQLMAQSRNVSEISSLRTQLFSVQEEIEQINGRRQLLDRQVALATLTVSVSLPGAAPVVEEPTPSTIAASWNRAIDAGAVVIGGTIVALGVVIPLGLVTAPLWIGYLLWRRHQRRQESTPAVA